MKTALFTGAGASRAIGYPLTGELLPRVCDDLRNGSLFEKMGDSGSERRDRALLKRYIQQLLPGLASIPNDQLPLITDLFSLVEYSLAAGEALPIGGQEDLRRCRDLLKQAITDVLLGDFQELNDDLAERESEEEYLGLLVDWICQLGDSVGLVTTNYDIGVDHELYKRVGRGLGGREGVYKIIDLGYDWRQIERREHRRRPEKPGLRIFKLHGSLDTLLCRNCGFVYFNPWGPIAHQAFRSTLDDNNTCECRDDIRLELHIVSPSLVREIRDATLLNSWRSALEWMRVCRHWVIAGYSLPPEDLAIRSLLLRAYHGASSKPKITVVQKGAGLESRYRALFPDCRYESGGLEEFLERELGRSKVKRTAKNRRVP